MTISVRIGGQTFPIQYQDNEDPSNRDARGPIYGSAGETGIEINPDLSPPVAASTLMHEALHLMYRVYGIGRRLSEEKMCLSWEGPLLAFIVDNPRLINQLRAAAKGKPIVGITPAT